MFTAPSMKPFAVISLASRTSRRNGLAAASWSFSADGAIVPKPSGKPLMYLSNIGLMSNATGTAVGGTAVGLGAAVGGTAVGMGAAVGGTTVGGTAVAAGAQATTPIARIAKSSARRATLRAFIRIPPLELGWTSFENLSYFFFTTNALGGRSSNHFGCSILAYSSVTKPVSIELSAS